MREAYFSILVDGHPQVLYKLLYSFTSLWSFTIKAVQKLIVCILPARVLLALFYTLVNTGGYVATPPDKALQSTRSTLSPPLGPVHK